MFDWKIFAGLPAAGAIVGYIGSVFSDPLKKAINDGILRRRIRRNLYREIASNYSGLVLFLDPERLKLLEPRFLENIRDFANKSAFDHAMTQQEIAIVMKEWATIEQIYKSLKKILDKPSPEIPEYAFLNFSLAAQLGKGLISMTEEAATSGTLSITLFFKVSPDISSRLHEIKSGKRRKSSEIYEDIETRALDSVINLMQSEPPNH